MITKTYVKAYFTTILYGLLFLAGYPGVVVPILALLIGNAWVGIMLTPWLLLLTVPVSAALVPLLFMLANTAIEKGVDGAEKAWGGRHG